jgi:ribosome-binding ATPase YchF (GTP1/OBG family)
MPHPAPHLEPFRWQPGNPGGPGRPKGSRSKLQEIVLKALHEDFEQHGVEAIRRVRERRPEAYLAACVSLLPKQQQKIESPFENLTDEELEQLEKFLKMARAKTAPTIIDANVQDARERADPEPQEPQP